MHSTRLKQNLRRNILANRLSDVSDKNDQDRLILTELENFINKKQIIGLYWPLLGEPNLMNLTLSHNIAIPKIVNDKISFIYYKGGDKLIDSKIPGLYYPQSDESVEPQIILIPALAYDLKGVRLGFGKGHYDRYLNNKTKALKIGVCYHKYLHTSLPFEQHDIKMNYIVTEAVIIKI